MFVPFDPKAQRATIISGPPDPRYDLGWATYHDDESIESSAAFRARMERDCARPIAIPRHVYIRPLDGCTAGPALIRPAAMRAEDV